MIKKKKSTVLPWWHKFKDGCRLHLEAKDTDKIKSDSSDKLYDDSEVDLPNGITDHWDINTYGNNIL